MREAPRPCVKNTCFWPARFRGTRVNGDDGPLAELGLENRQVLVATVLGMTITPLNPVLGAEIVEVDLSGPLSGAAFREIRQAFLDSLVLVFRNQSVPPRAQVAFTERFGAVEPHPLRSRRSHEDHPGVFVLENRPSKPSARNDIWHSDISFSEKPPQLSVLHAVVALEGKGDTLFANMYAAYEGLPDPLKQSLLTMRAEHNAARLARRNEESPGTDGRQIRHIPPPVEHPVVRTHPETGRLALYINPYFTSRIIGIEEEKSTSLLASLYAHSTREENFYRHCWRPGDLVMWDNRCTMHYAVHDYDDTMPRLMHRTTAAGDRPV